MSEHWKSTPKYWCKHCSTYVRDTKLEKQNHESTAKHQNAIKRSLRDLHRNHEREGREKERAMRELDRLNGVVPGSTTTSGFISQGEVQPGSSSKPTEASGAELKRQREQLAELGVAMPDEMRPAMALPGEWTVTSSSVVEPHGPEEQPIEAKAEGVRKRPLSEEDKEESELVKGLFKKPRGWGRDPRVAPSGTDLDLDTLLNKSLSAPNPAMASAIAETKVETQIQQDPQVKLEKDADSDSALIIKKEPRDAHGIEENVDGAVKAEDSDTARPMVVFKKRKTKKSQRT